jgi:hypothetical protein
LARRFAVDLLAHRLFDDVIDNVGRGVIDAARLLDFGLLFDFGLMGGGEPDHFAEELLVDVTHNLGGHLAEFVGIGII